MLAKLKALIGLDIKEKEYAYGKDSQFGYTSESRIPEKWVKTTCGYCSVGCGMLMGIKNGKVIAVRGDNDHPVNEGKLCPKGLSEHHFLSSPDRLLYPHLKSEKSNFLRIEWDKALNHFKSEVARIQTKYGNDSFAILSTGQLVTEEFYALGKLVRLGLKTSNFDGNTTLCMASAVVGYKQSFGSDGPPGSYKGLETADLVFLIGANIADNHPILWYRLSKNKKRTLIVCDPRKSKTAMFADIFLPIKPRGDIALLNGIIHLLIEWGNIDLEYIQKNTIGFEELKTKVEKYTPDYAGMESGLDKELIIKTAKAISMSPNVFYGWTMGVNHSTQGSDTVSLINTLALITGNIGRTGAAPMSITGQCNAMGTREYGFTASMPGYRNFLNETHRKELAEIWNVSPEEIPSVRGQAYPDIIDGILSGKIKGLWVIGTNPLASFPDRNRMETALSSLEFLVVQDGFGNTPTAKMADLLLPAGMWGEKEGTFTNSERRISRVKVGTAPVGEAKSDFNIFLEIAKVYGIHEKIYPEWKSPEDAFNEMRKISKGRLNDCSAADYAKLEALGGIQWPCTETYPEGKDSLYSEGKFQTESGKANLISIDPLPLPENVSNGYPLILNTGRTVEHWHTRTKTGVVPILEYLSPVAWVEVNPKTAKFYEISSGEKIRIISKRGSIDKILVRVTETVQEGHIFIPFHFFEACANNLTYPAFDPKSREPNYKQSAVRIEKLSSLL